MAGLTYVCEDDIAHILEHKCIDIKYEVEKADGLDNNHQAAVLTQEQRVCGRPLIDFLNGKPLKTKDNQMIKV